MYAHYTKHMLTFSAVNLNLFYFLSKWSEASCELQETFWKKKASLKRFQTLKIETVKTTIYFWSLNSEKWRKAYGFWEGWLNRKKWEMQPSTCSKNRINCLLLNWAKGHHAVGSSRMRQGNSLLQALNQNLVAGRKSRWITCTWMESAELSNICVRENWT